MLRSPKASKHTKDNLTYIVSIVFAACRQTPSYPLDAPDNPLSAKRGTCSMCMCVYVYVYAHNTDVSSTGGVMSHTEHTHLTKTTLKRDDRIGLNVYRSWWEILSVLK